MKDKNVNVEFILCFFFGYLGIHKFYKGDSKLGFIYLFTFGIFGIGWLFDILQLLIKLTSSNTKNITVTNHNYIYEIHPANNFVDDYIVFDLETTGLNSITDKIIEIGALKYKNNKLIDSFNTFVNPLMPIPKNITNLTGITNNDVKNSKTIKQILPEFITFVEDYTLIAHNNSFDLKFILQNLKNLNLPCISNKTIDTLSLSKEYIKDVNNYKLDTLKSFFNINIESHKAINDCKITNTIYQYCKNKELNTVIN